MRGAPQGGIPWDRSHPNQLNLHFLHFLQIEIGRRGQLDEQEMARSGVQLEWEQTFLFALTPRREKYRPNSIIWAFHVRGTRILLRATN